MSPSIDREDLTLVFERQFPAPPEKVFDAWTRPEQIAEWWDPTGARLVGCEIDLRVGGRFCFVNEGHGPPFEGRYSVIDRPTRLEFEALGSVGTVLLETKEGGTRMRVVIRCASSEHLEHFVKLGVATGTDRTLDNLVSYLS